MSDTDTAAPERAPRTGRRLAVVAVVAAAGFGGALLVMGGGDEGASDEQPQPVDEQVREPAADPAGADYEVTVDLDPDPPRLEGTAFAVRVTHEGEPVTGADVQVRADMDGHAHEGITATATEVDPGHYETGEQRFPMRGGWIGQVSVSGAEGSASAPLRFTVD
ncbi:MAG: FixH family protein [Egibacteraceae bacterium]